jgi:hypothetical protein
MRERERRVRAMSGGEGKMLEEKIRIVLNFFFCRHVFCRWTS